MLNKIYSKKELTAFLTRELLENKVGVIVDEAMPQDSYIAIDIDEYYHRMVPAPTPAIADLILVAQRLSYKDQYHIYIIEMKNISSPHYFTVKNIYEKFHTAVDDFIKKKYADIFLDEKYQVKKFRLFFVSDAYRLRQKGFTKEQIRSYLLETKIMAFQSLPVFHYRNFNAIIEYQLPNPSLEWF